MAIARNATEHEVELRTRHKQGSGPTSTRPRMWAAQFRPTGLSKPCVSEKLLVENRSRVRFQRSIFCSTDSPRCPRDGVPPRYILHNATRLFRGTYLHIVLRHCVRGPGATKGGTSDVPQSLLLSLGYRGTVKR